MNKPLVSIVMAVFNGEDYILETVNSILNQNYSNFELIIVDDASKDTTYELISNISDKRVKILRNEENMKLAYSLNKGIAYSKGKYIARMDADDICIPQRLERQVQYLENHSDIDVVGGNYIAFGKISKKSHYYLANDYIKTGLLFENTICHPAVMFRGESLDMKYDISFKAGQDYDLWVRMIETHKFANLKEYVIKYRIHEGQTVNKMSIAQEKGANSSRLVMLSRVGEFSDEEKKLFLRSCDIFDIKKSNEIYDIYNLFKRIEQSNKVIKYYREDVLSHFICRYFWENFYMSAKTNKIYLGKEIVNDYGFYLLKNIKMLCKVMAVLFGVKRES